MEKNTYPKEIRNSKRNLHAETHQHCKEHHFTQLIHSNTYIPSKTSPKLKFNTHTYSFDPLLKPGFGPSIKSASKVWADDINDIDVRKIITIIFYNIDLLLRSSLFWSRGHVVLLRCACALVQKSKKTPREETNLFGFFLSQALLRYPHKQLFVFPSIVYQAFLCFIEFDLCLS